MSVASNPQRPDLARYLIAARWIMADWPDTGAIRKAHYDYDAGRVEIATARCGDRQYLYAIPRRRLAHDRHPYFSRVKE